MATDQGTEFMGVFAQYLSNNGIMKRKGFAYYHTHPGKAERAHQSILHQARAMLISSKLPMVFYADALLTAAYIHNRTIHSGHKKSPFHLLYGVVPRTKHLRPFGCIAYVHIPQKLRSKLDPAAYRCCLLGYLDDDDTEEMLGFKLLRESDCTIILSRDVIFDEAVEMTRLTYSGIYDTGDADDDLRDSIFSPSDWVDSDDSDCDPDPYSDPDDHIDRPIHSHVRQLRSRGGDSQVLTRRE